MLEYVKVREVVVRLGYADNIDEGFRAFFGNALEHSVQVMLDVRDLCATAAPRSLDRTEQYLNGIALPYPERIETGYELVESFMLRGSAERWYPVIEREDDPRDGDYTDTGGQLLQTTPWEYVIERQALRRLVSLAGWSDLLATDTVPAVSTPGPGASEAIASILDKGHDRHAPELATAIRCWLKFYSESGAARASVKELQRWIGTQPATGSQGAQERIAAVVNPEAYKRGGAMPTDSRGSKKPSQQNRP